MPYIASKDRESLDKLIDKLADQIVTEAREHGYDAAFAGLLNYTCTRLALKVVKIQFGKIRYWTIAAITGVFKNVADEFYRRVGVPYEGKQIEKNGDVDLYAEFFEDIGKL